MRDDNRHLRAKVALRWHVLQELRAGEPLRVLEPYAGAGRLGRRVYEGAVGVAIERDRDKATQLALARPGWLVFQAEAEDVVPRLGGWTFDLVDVDPWGSPWEVVAGAFRAGLFAERAAVVATDGALQAHSRDSWRAETRRAFEARGAKRGSPASYATASRSYFAELASGAGYRVEAWSDNREAVGRDAVLLWAARVARE